MVNTVVHPLKAHLEYKCRLKVVCHPIQSTQRDTKKAENNNYIDKNKSSGDANVTKHFCLSNTTYIRYFRLNILALLLL